MKYALIPLLLCIILSKPVADGDLFTQIELGKALLGSAAALPVPAGYDPVALSPYAQPGVLAQVLYGALAFFSENLGFEPVQAIRVVSYLSVVIALAYFCTPLAAVLSLFSLLPFIATRPLLLIIPLALWLLTKLQKSRLSRTELSLVLLIGVLWQNIHPSVLLIAFVFFVKVLFSKEKSFLSAGILLSFTSLCTPLGISIFEVSKRNLQVSSALHVSEWANAFSEHGLLILAPVFISALLAGYLIRTQKIRFSTEQVAFIFFLALSLYSIRFGFFAALLLPFAIRSVKVPRYAATIFGATLACLTLFAPKLSDYVLPTKITESLREKKGRVFVTRELAPFVQAEKVSVVPFLDGRLYLRSEKNLELYQESIANPNIERIIQESSCTSFLLHRGVHDAIIEKLRGANPELFLEIEGSVLVDVQDADRPDRVVKNL